MIKRIMVALMRAAPAAIARGIAWRLCHPGVRFTPVVATALMVVTGARDAQTAIERLRAHDPAVTDLRTAVEAVIRMMEESARCADDPAMRQAALTSRRT